MESFPVSESDRIVPLDVVRGFAVLGILVMNVVSFGLPDAAYLNPHGLGRIAGADWWTWLVGHLLADTKFMDLFSMLFGAGVLLFTMRVEGRGRSPRRLHYRRMFWLLLFGLAHAHLLWSGDILFAYAVCGMLVYPLRRRSVPVLLLLGGAATAVFLGLLLLTGWSMAWWSPERIAELRNDVWSPSPEAVAGKVEAFRGEWLDQARARTPASLFMEFLYLPGYVVWKVTGMMLIGMALLKDGVLSAARSDRFYGGMVLAGLLVGLPVILLGVRWNEAAGWDIRASMFTGKVFNHGAGILVALAWAGLVMLAVRRRILPGLATRLAAVGRMAFTNYIAQTVLCTTLFYGHGFGLFGSLPRSQLLAVVAAVWVLELAWSPWWLARFRFGPLEWAWRALTYGTRPPFRRTAAEVPAAG